MSQSCPHCASTLPALQVLGSALGIRSSFACGNCARRLTVSAGWKAALAGALLLAVVACRVVVRLEHSRQPYLALPFIFMLALLVVYHFGVVRIASARLGWLSLFNLGMFGTALLALDYAISL